MHRYVIHNVHHVEAFCAEGGGGRTSKLSAGPPLLSAAPSRFCPPRVLRNRRLLCLCPPSIRPLLCKATASVSKVLFSCSLDSAPASHGSATATSTEDSSITADIGLAFAVVSPCGRSNVVLPWLVSNSSFPVASTLLAGVPASFRCAYFGGGEHS